LKSAGGITYGYDPEGERVSQSGAGGSISYVNENNLGLTKVLQRTKDGQTVRYVWGAGLLYEVNASAEATYYHYDNYGSTIALTDDNEAVTDRVEYSPFGSIIHREGTHDTPFLFTGFFGNQTDESGLIHMRARFYNPLIRRFVNADPAQQGWNWYAYAAGNPLGFVDPTGLGNASILDAVQTGLSFLGMAPVVGFVADVANSGISVARGNYADASINLAAAVPGFGQAVTGAKFAAAGAGVFGAIRTADRLGDLGRGTSRLPAPSLRTGVGYGAGDTPVRINGDWSINDMKQALLGHPPRGLGSPDIHHGGQMPRGALHEVLPQLHRNNAALHRNRFNQGVTPEMRASDRQLHWWYRAREQGADELLPDWIYD
jgi:RHS repeat-associated protein